jgi:hypothetical protein
VTLNERPEQNFKGKGQTRVFQVDKGPTFKHSRAGLRGLKRKQLTQDGVAWGVRPTPESANGDLEGSRGGRQVDGYSSGFAPIKGDSSISPVNSGSAAASVGALAAARLAGIAPQAAVEMEGDLAAIQGGYHELHFWRAEFLDQDNERAFRGTSVQGAISTLWATLMWHNAATLITLLGLIDHHTNALGSSSEALHTSWSLYVLGTTTGQLECQRRPFGLLST